MNKSRRGYLFSLAAVVLTALLGVSAEAATLTVRSGADAGGTCPGATCTLRQAIATAAASGDTIDFYPGLRAITLTSAELLISKALTISGPGANLLSVRRSAAAGTPNFRIFNVVANTVTISGLTISNGNTGNNGLGGGLLNDGGTVSLTNCAISGNSAPGGNGGGLDNRTSAAVSKMTITNCTVSGNTANSGGGIGNGTSGAGPTMTIINSTISGNIADGAGGIITLATLTMTNCTITGNSTPVGEDTSGGGLYVFTGTVTLRNTIIALNTAKSGPDIIGSVTSQGYNFIGNNDSASFAPTTGDQVGTNASPRDPLLGPLQDNGGPTKTHALLSGSTAIEAGNSSGSNTDGRGFARPVDSPSIANVGDGSDIGAYEVQADVLPGCSNINKVVGNLNDAGANSLRGVIAAVCAGSTITFDPNLTGAITLTSAELLVNKSLTIVGPGPKILAVGRSFTAGTPDFRIFNIAANLNVAISGLFISNGNASSSSGGGIYNNSTLTLVNDIITLNGAVFGGAGIHNNGGVLTLTNSTVSNNSVDTGGAGILNSGTLTVTNSTLYGNAANGGNGGGIANSGTTTIASSTISGNKAPSGAGGGIHNPSGTTTVRNSIIALNTATSAPDFNGALTSQGFNLIGNSSGTVISPIIFTDQVGTAGSPLDPLLALAATNGGSTYTRAPLPGSPALDKGDSGGLTTDQRGFPRPIDLVNTSNATGGDGSDIGAFEVQATTLANIATRLRVETGDGALFAGFIVTGTAPKKVIIRAIGPSTGVADHLADPILELHDSFGATLDSNDNWQDSANKQAIIDSTVAPTNPLESAIVATLPAGNAGYTAIIRGANNGTGIGVVEAYDLDILANSKLANISTRGLVGTGDNVLFAGTIVVGQESQKVIVRALGPSTGVSGSMADPTLELRDGQGSALETNDNWVDSPNKQAIIDSTVPPTNDKESAIVYTLPAGGANYTAIVHGANNTTGIAVVEVYALN